MNQLDNCRQRINILDIQIIEILGARFKVCRRIAHFKKEQGIPMMQPGRVEEVKQRCMELGLQYGLQKEFVAELYSLIIKESCRIEDEIIEKS
ncbi:chorismate mutase [Mastigocoleus testarum]|uniref:4-amino-4-deoxychorismate mutase n=1 Tax=Mastigocoleus testarum BC008 TaxID=371196 RepID=A0A0V7ZVI8_9CYAN|nr:chorismate mutase [Mastigocoleus testarum]KST68520.1 4-amino-4-deoxychorismate mutase [Mastigocoleus testarum BC008]KST68657.1 4-amino-4-deoxychorismate mutase [Mastigocoleus testarum BC008]